MRGISGAILLHRVNFWLVLRRRVAASALNIAPCELGAGICIVRLSLSSAVARKLLIELELSLKRAQFREKGPFFGGA